jgi:hypothetical protein|tara:strand:+ start:2369 stop:2797 length:429 start_codon:yes stop_codon:yes gene_type:complete
MTTLTAVKKQAYISSLIKSQKKMNIMLANSRGIYDKIKAVRPYFLKVIRLYDVLEHNFEWSEFLQVAYKKSCLMLKQIEEQEKGVDLKVKEVNYINSFKKNLKNVKKMCEDTSITYYSLLPDRMPIDVRTHCVQFISQATIN